jgi:hypothetical protein
VGICRCPGLAGLEARIKVLEKRLNALGVHSNGVEGNG